MLVDEKETVRPREQKERTNGERRDLSADGKGKLLTAESWTCSLADRANDRRNSNFFRRLKISTVRCLDWEIESSWEINERLSFLRSFRSARTSFNTS